MASEQSILDLIKDLKERQQRLIEDLNNYDSQISESDSGGRKSSRSSARKSQLEESIADIGKKINELGDKLILLTEPKASPPSQEAALNQTPPKTPSIDTPLDDTTLLSKPPIATQRAKTLSHSLLAETSSVHTSLGDTNPLSKTPIPTQRAKTLSHSLPAETPSIHTSLDNTTLLSKPPIPTQRAKTLSHSLPAETSSVHTSLDDTTLLSKAPIPTQRTKIPIDTPSHALPAETPSVHTSLRDTNPLSKTPIATPRTKTPIDTPSHSLPAETPPAIQKSVTIPNSQPKDSNACRSCRKTIKVENLKVDSSCLSLLSKRLLDPIKNQSSFSQPRITNLQQSHTACLNCGQHYNKENQSVSKCSFHKPNSRTCKSPMTASKCSQRSQSVAPCQSFDTCSKCNEMVFDTSADGNDGGQEAKSDTKSTTGASNQQVTPQTVSSEPAPVSTAVYNNNKIDEKDYCGCNTTLKCLQACQAACEDNSGAGGGEDNSEKLRQKLKQLENFTPKLPVEMDMLFERVENMMVCNPVPRKKPEKKNKKNCSTRPRLHRTKKLRVDSDCFECPPVCCVPEELKQKYQKLVEKVAEREKSRQINVAKQKKEKLLKMLAEMNEGGVDDSAADKNSCEPQEKDCTEYSKKYLKLKHEIEMQNYLVEKLNRQIGEGICKKYPECALAELRFELEKEIKKLRDMVEFTIFEQCKNKGLKWGPIPISVCASKLQPKKKKVIVMPRTPSGLSNISGFSTLEDIKLSQERERHNLDIEEKATREKNIQQLLVKFQHLHTTMTKLKCEQKRLQENMTFFDTQARNTHDAVAERIDFLGDIKNKMEEIVSGIQSTKSDIDLLHTKLHLIKNP